MPSSLRLEFGNLPLVEAAVRATLADDLPLRFGTIFEAHDRLRDRFPKLTEPERHEVPPGVSEMVQLRPGIITGVVLADETNGMFATVQSRVVVVRWLKRLGTDAPKYPRFPALRDALWQVLDVFKQVSELESLPVAVVNMSYTNFIDVSDPSTAMERYFSKKVQMELAMDAERVHQVELSWRKDDVDLRFRLQLVEAELDGQKKEGLKLTTIAGSSLGAGDGNPRDTLESVHQRLQYLFRDLLSDHAKREWQLREV